MLAGSEHHSTMCTTFGRGMLHTILRGCRLPHAAAHAVAAVMVAVAATSMPAAAAVAAEVQYSQDGLAMQQAAFMTARSSDDGAAAFVTESDPGPIQIGLLQLLFAVLLVLVTAVVSIYFQLGLHWRLAVAGLRSVLQLMLLGYLVLPVVEFGPWWLVLLLSVAMVVLASIEAVSRPRQTYRGMLRDTLLCMAGASLLTALYTMLLVIPARPLYTARYLIPVLGLLLGSCISGAGSGLAAVLTEMAAGRSQIELMLALGANRVEATAAVVQAALTASLSALLSQLSTAGLVSLPSIMIGQILQGASPVQASRYELSLLFCVGAASTLSAVGPVLLAVRHLVDDEDMYRADRLRARQHDSGTLLYLRSKLQRVSGRLHHILMRIYLSFCGGRRSMSNAHHWRLAGSGQQSVRYRTATNALRSFWGSRATQYLRAGDGEDVRSEEFDDADSFSSTFFGVEDLEPVHNTTTATSMGGMSISSMRAPHGDRRV